MKNEVTEHLTFTYILKLHFNIENLKIFCINCDTNIFQIRLLIKATKEVPTEAFPKSMSICSQLNIQKVTSFNIL